MRDLDAEIKLYTTLAGLAMTAGASMMCIGAYQLAGWAGASIALGFPLLAWGWSMTQKLTEIEALDRKG